MSLGIADGIEDGTELVWYEGMSLGIADGIDDGSKEV